MPATTSAAGKSKSEENGKFRFAKCDLTDGMKADLKRWREDGAEPAALIEWISKRVASGHTLSIKGQEVGFMAILSGVREASGHVNISLTARASSPENALYSLQYKDELILKGRWEAVDWSSELDL